MITKTALIAALVFGTASVAMATEFDPNLANRYPAYAAPKAQTMQSRNVSMTGAPSIIVHSDVGFDRASNPYAGGGM